MFVQSLLRCVAASSSSNSNNRRLKQEAEFFYMHALLMNMYSKQCLPRPQIAAHALLFAMRNSNCAQSSERLKSRCTQSSATREQNVRFSCARAQALLSIAIVGEKSEKSELFEHKKFAFDQNTSYLLQNINVNNPKNYKCSIVSVNFI